MPKFGFNLKDATLPSDKVVYTAGDESLRLSRTRPNGAYDPTADYNTAQVITLPALAMPNLTQVFAFAIDAEYDLDPLTEDELGTVGVEVSMDGGTTWYYWNPAGGGSWTATTTLYSTAAEIDTHCLTIPRPSTGAISPRVRLRLSADADLRHTPVVRSVLFGGEVDDVPYADAIRSIIRYLKTNVQVRADVTWQATTTGTSHAVPTKWTIASVTGAWNLTSDPSCTTSIYSSGTSTITTTGSVTAGQLIKVRLLGTCDVKPLTEEEVGDNASPLVPAIFVLPLDGERDERFGNWREIIASSGRLKARSRVPSEMFVQRVRLYCDSDRNTEAFQMAEAVSRALEGTTMTYLPTGEPMNLVDIEHLSSMDVDSRGLYSKQIEFAVDFRRHSRTYAEDTLLQTVNVAVTDIAATNAADSFTVVEDE